MQIRIDIDHPAHLILIHLPKQAGSLGFSPHGVLFAATVKRKKLPVHKGKTRSVEKLNPNVRGLCKSPCTQGACVRARFELVIYFSF